MSSSQRLILATRNAHKIDELRAILTGAGLDVTLLGVQDFPEVPEVPARTGSSTAAAVPGRRRRASTV